MVSEISGLGIYITYVKLRFLYAMMALSVFYCLAFHLSASRFIAGLASLCLCVLIVVDPSPWSWPASQFPFIRRGSVASGILLPLGILFTILVTKSATRDFRCGIAIPPIFTWSLATTHALESVTFMFWLAGWAAFHWFNRGDWFLTRRATAILLVGFVSLAFYKVLHGEVGTNLAAFERFIGATVDSSSLWRELAGPVTNYFGAASTGYQFLVTMMGTVNPFAFVPLLALPLGVVLSYQSAASLWWAVAPSIPRHLLGGRYTILVLLTTREIKQIYGYYALFGLIAFVLICHHSFSWLLLRADAAASWRKSLCRSAIFATLVGFTLGGDMFIGWLYANPLSVAGTLLAALALIILGVGKKKDSLGVGHMTLRPLVVGGLTILAAVILTNSARQVSGRLWGFERVSLWSNIQESTRKPSVVEWDRYYPMLQTTLGAPKLLLSWPDVERLRKIVPKQSVVIFDPEGSFALPAFLDLYIVNPGNLTATALQYYEEFVEEDSKSSEYIHPIFNNREAMTDKEFSLLESQAVDYVIASHQYRLAVQVKFSNYPERFSEIYASETLLVYVVLPKL